MMMWTPWSSRAATQRKHRFHWALLSEEQDEPARPSADSKSDPSAPEPEKPPYWPLSHPCDPEDL
jgi:hypothetical protein